MTLVFENPGEIDPRAAVTFGVNAKGTDSPIGFFGTGLKYAIAVVLRLGGRIEIYAGNRKYLFTAIPTEIRGREFGIVHLTTTQLDNDYVVETVPLGFTTDVGKTWEPWMAYRELRTNALDEGGEAYGGSTDVDRVGVPDRTLIIVDCPEVEAAHARGYEYFLRDREGEMLFDVPGRCEVYAGSSKFVFFRGIRIHELERPATFTYNVTHPIDLTEDRIAKYGWEVDNLIRGAVLAAAEKRFLETVLTADKELTYEGRFDYDTSYLVPGAGFLETARELAATRANDLNPSAFHAMKKHVKPDITEYTPSAKDVALLNDALAALLKMGYAVDAYPIKHVEGLGERVIGMASDGKILLSRLAFENEPGTLDLAATIFEEWAHLHTGHHDCTRRFQDWLIREIIRVGAAK